MGSANSRNDYYDSFSQVCGNKNGHLNVQTTQIRSHILSVQGVLQPCFSVVVPTTVSSAYIFTVYSDISSLVPIEIT